MSCDQVRELLSAYLENELEPASADLVRHHLGTCSTCSELVQTLQLVTGSTPFLQRLEPPAHLAAEIVANPCRRWLGLLFSAVDREISDHNLARLLGHLESCEGCRRTWNDLTLVHQVGDSVEPPAGLLQRCLDARITRRVRRVIGRRTVVAAAYLLALLIGPPVTLARQEAAIAMQTVADVLTAEANVMAESGQDELRRMFWRTWHWGQRQVSAAKQIVDTLAGDDSNGSDNADQGGKQ